MLRRVKDGAVQSRGSCREGVARPPCGIPYTCATSSYEQFATLTSADRVRRGPSVTFSRHWMTGERRAWWPPASA